VAERIPTLIFRAQGVPNRKRVLFDSLMQLPPGPLLERAARSILRRHPALLSYLFGGYDSLSYVRDWQDAFSNAPSLDVHLCTITRLLEFRHALKRLKDYPLVVILHSAAGDNLALLRSAAASFQARRGKLLVFFGNEYNLMRDKIGFARQVGADYIASQLPKAAAEWLYAECAESRVLLAPGALSPRVYQPRPEPRPIHLGFRGARYGLWLGDVERTQVLDYFKDRATDLGLVADIEFTRYPREEWIVFLNRCQGTVGAESGTYYLEKDDHTMDAVQLYLRRHPAATFAEVFERFYQNYPNPVSGKAVSSRHFEPMGTKTCQILLEGDYNGILTADQHFLSLKKDFSNIEEVVGRFKDAPYRQALVERTYEYALANHTYQHRVNALLSQVL